MTEMHPDTIINGKPILRTMKQHEVLVICDECGTPFFTMAHRAKEATVTLCSNSCALTHMFSDRIDTLADKIDNLLTSVKESQ